MAWEGLEKMQLINGIYLGIEFGIFRATVESYFSSENDTPVTVELVLPTE